MPTATIAKAFLVLKAKAGGLSNKLSAAAGKRLIEAVEKGSLKVASPADQLVIFEFLESEGRRLEEGAADLNARLTARIAATTRLAALDPERRAEFERRVRIHSKLRPELVELFEEIVDRYADSFACLGLAAFFRDSWVLWAVLFALLGGLIVSYTRARAEGLGFMSLSFDHCRHCGRSVLDVLDRVNRDLGTTVAVITHNAAIGGMADRVVLPIGHSAMLISARVAAQVSAFLADGKFLAHPH